MPKKTSKAYEILKKLQGKLHLDVDVDVDSARERVPENPAIKIFDRALEEIRSQNLYKDERLICSPQAGVVKVRFPQDSSEKEIINLCSNNYLGLSSHPDVIEAAHAGLDQRGYG